MHYVSSKSGVSVSILHNLITFSAALKGRYVYRNQTLLNKFFHGMQSCILEAQSPRFIVISRGAFRNFCDTDFHFSNVHDQCSIIF